MPFLFEIPLVVAHALFLFAFFCLTFGLGRGVLRVLGLRPPEDLSLVALSCGIGVWFLSQLVMGLGLLGRLSRPSLLVLLALLSVVSFRSFKPFGRSLKTLIEPAFQGLRSRPALFSLKTALLLFCLFYLGTCFLALSCPDLTYDSLTYHLYLPRLYLQSGKIQFLPQLLFSAFPQNMEMLHLVGFAVGGEGFARVPTLMVLCLSLLLLGGFAKGFLRGKITGLLAAVLFLSVPNIFYQAPWALVDIASGYYALGSLFCLMRGHGERNVRWFFLAGLLSAAGLGVKYFYLLQLGSLTLLLISLWISLPRGKRYSLPASLCLMTGTALLFGSPWYLRNCLVTGNPFYPLFYSLFGGPSWSAGLERGMLAVRQFYGPAKSWLNYLILPFWLLKNEGYWPLAFAPLFLLTRNRIGRWAGWIAGLCLVEIAVWFFCLTFLMRFGVFWQFLAALLLAAALAPILEGTDRSPLFRKTIPCLLTVFMLVSLRPVATVTARGLSVVLGVTTREALLSRFMESYPIFAYLNETLPPEAKVASFGDTRGFYCERPFFPIHPDASGYIDLNRMDDAETYRRRLREIGITHVLYNPRRTESFRKRYPHWLSLQRELEKKYLTLVKKERWVSLYELK